MLYLRTAGILLLLEICSPAAQFRFPLSETAGAEVIDRGLNPESRRR
jgi:hypothetical protein